MKEDQSSLKSGRAERRLENYFWR